MALEISPSKTVSEGIQCELGCESYRHCVPFVKEERSTSPDNLSSLAIDHSSTCFMAPLEIGELNVNIDVKPAIHEHLEKDVNHMQFVCGFCGETFLVAEDLESHCYKAHSGDFPFKCHHCGKIYQAWVGSEGFRAHLYSMCAFSGQCFTNSDDCNENSTSPSQLPLIDFCELVCGDCGIQLSSSSLYENHCRTHNLTEPYKCIECVMRFKKRLHLEEHKASHLLVNPYQCDECSREFSFKWALLVHSKEHGSHNDVLCCICGALFLNQDYMENHKLLEHKDFLSQNHVSLNFSRKWCNVHSGQFVPCLMCKEMPKKHDKFSSLALVCEECGVQFVSEDELRAHLQCHESPQLFKCEECDKSYGSYLGLREHVNLKHNDVEVNWCGGCSGTGYIHVSLRSDCDTSDDELQNVEVIQEMVETDHVDGISSSYNLFSSKNKKSSPSAELSKCIKRKSVKISEQPKQVPQNPKKQAKLRNTKQNRQSERPDSQPK